jgi:hypothetical protein
MLRLFLGIVFVALVATVGDYVWFEIGIRHQATAGAAHGALLLGSVGLVLGWLSGRIAAGLVAGIAAGVGGAVAYYALAAGGGRSDTFPAMIAAWAAVWIVLAVADGRLLRRRSPRGWTEVLVRGVLAAGLGGLAFWAVLGIIWGGPPADGRNYLTQFGAWLVAWAPGMLAIGGGRKK